MSNKARPTRYNEPKALCLGNDMGSYLHARLHDEAIAARLASLPGEHLN